MPANPSASSSATPEELSALVGELQAANADLQAANADLQRVVEGQAARIEELERQLGADSSTSSKPPSSDGPYRKPPRRSSRKASGRRPGKQPGQPGSTMPLVEDPDEIIRCDPVCCPGCGAALSGVQTRRPTMQRHSPAPAATQEAGAPSPPGGGTGVRVASAPGGTIHIADLRDLPPTVDIETAARILGCGRTLAYELAKRGEFPCRVLRLGKRYLVPTAALLESLGLHAGDGSLARGDTDRAAV